MDRRLCSALARVFGDGKHPTRYGDLRERFRENPLKLPTITGQFQPLDHEPVYAGTSGGNSPAELSLPSGMSYAQWLDQALEYVDALAKTGGLYDSPTGKIRMRPALVRDPLGRTLEFSYFDTQPTLANDAVNPKYGLLARVDGPQGSWIEYDYARPPEQRRKKLEPGSGDMFLINPDPIEFVSAFPAELNETFLVSATREPGDYAEGSNLNRVYEYEYGWSTPNVPGHVGGWWNAVSGFATDFYDAYFQYFARHVACYLRSPGDDSLCYPTGMSTIIDGEPCELAELKRRNYLSAVAGNIVRVRRNGTIESESEYVLKPDRDDFNRVVNQRYGGMQTEAVGDGWESGYPDFGFEYVSAGPTSNNGELDRVNDLTDGLPGEITSRYALEPLPDDEDFRDRLRHADRARTGFLDASGAINWSQKADEDDVCVPSGDRTQDDVLYCWTGHPAGPAQLLPGHQPTFPYFDVEPDDAERPQLQRSRLTCEQLATVQVGDPTHNANLTTYYEEALSEEEALWEAWECDSWSPIDPTLPTIGFPPGAGASNGNTEQVDCYELARTYHCVSLMSELPDIEDPSAFEESLMADAKVTYEEPVNRGGSAVDFGRRCEDEMTEFIDDASPKNAIKTVRYERVVTKAGRERVARNARRICNWAKVDDRDDNTRWYGLNYRGKALVEVEFDNDQYIFTEHIYNADGSLVETREPVTGNGLSDAYATFDWDEAIPLVDDSGSLPEDFVRVVALDESAEASEDEWRWPYWMRRNNLLEVRNVADSPVYAVDGDGDGALVTSESFSYTYDDLSNEVASFAHRVRHYGASDDVELFLVEVEFDHGGDQDAYFDGDALGLPAVVESKAANDPGSERIDTYEWAPHGLPKRIQTADGNDVRFYYYAAPSDPGAPAADFGAGSPPTLGSISGDNRGLLARVESSRFDLDYADSVPSALGLEAPCPERRGMGPYAWLGSGDCSLDLSQLGLVPETLAHLSDAQLDPADTTEFSYFETGHLRSRWEDGLETSYVRDTDGRIIERVDPDGARTQVLYTIDGWPQVEETINGAEVFDQIERRYDDEGRVLAECVALEPDGCAGVLDPLPAVGTASDPGRPDGANPRYQLRTYRYTGEGLLRAFSDPAGLVTIFEHNSRGQVISSHTAPPGSMEPSEGRQRSFSYDVRGRLTGVFVGTLEAFDFGPSVRSEIYDYDGFGRLSVRVDRRDKPWLFQYDAAGNRTNVRHLESGRTWRTGYNGHDEVVFTRIEDGADVVSTDLFRARDGRVIGVREDGRGTRWVTFDNSGNPVWMRDGEGNETLLTREPVDDGASAENERRSTEANIRLGAAEVLTTTTVTEYDERFLPVARTDYGHGANLVRDHFWERDAAGFVDRYVNPEQVETAYEARNLRGWPLTIAQERDGGWDRSQHTYDARGELVRVADPTGQATTYEFTPFGELASVTKPHYSQPVETYQYDHLGRRTLMSRANNDQRDVEFIAYEYDPDTGDPVREVWLNAPKPVVFAAGNLLIERTFDSLGRLTQATNYNPGLALFGPNVVPSEFIVHREFDYDVLDRVHRESTSVGSSGSYATESSYWLGGGAAPNAWNRVIAYPDSQGSARQQTVIAEYFDRNGRLDRVWGSVDQHTTDVSNNWLGELYAGRKQFWAANASPIAEQAEFDDLGRRLAWEYTGVDVDEASNPLDPLWGQEYCGGAWDPECARPLLRMDAVRDVMGRIGSLHWSFGHTRFDGQGARLPNDAHLEHWRGFTYDKRGALVGRWNHSAQADDGIDDTSLWTQNNSLVASTIDSFGMQEGAAAWDYLRESHVGSLTAIENRFDSTERTWSASRPTLTGPAGSVRADGHQLEEVSVDKTSYLLEHDFAGGVVSALGFHFQYDPYGRLMAVLDSDQNLVEAFGYDHDGRMSAKYDEWGVSEVYAYDGDQIIAAIDKGGNTLWQAVWGAGVDQLLNWYEAQTGDLYVPLTDHRNSVVASWSVDDRGLDQIAHYNPHGRLSLFDEAEDELCAEEGSPGVVCDNPSAIPFGFASALRSDATGLVYMRNRWYSPRLAQFMTHDPKGYVDSYNPYAYVGMDPINFWDPFGLEGSHTDGTPEDLDARHGWNPAYWVFTRAWLTLGADDDVRDRKHRRHMKQKFGDDLDESAIECGVSCELTNMAEAANGAVELVELGVGAVGIKRLGQYGVKKLAKANPCSSFAAGTQVHLCDGTTISIEEVEEGDFVLTKDADTGALECREIAHPYANPDRAIIELELEAEDGTLETIETTDNHPFYVEGRGWTRVDELDIGDRIPSAHGGLLRVTSATWTQRVETVYNFGVEEFRSYFVGESAAWVHNCWLGKNVRMTGTASSRRLRGYRTATSDLDGGLDAAKQSFKDLTGRQPKIHDQKSLAPTDSYTEPGKIEVHFRPMSESGTPAVEVIDHGAQTYEKIHFN